MKRIVCVLLLAMCAFVCAAAQGKAEQELLKLEQQWVDALVKADTAALEKLYGDGLIYTHSSGAVDTKASYIEGIKTGKSKYESLDRDDVKVKLYGTTAIVTAHSVIKVNKNTINARYIHVYVREKGVWKMVAHQSTRLAQ